MTVDFLQTTGDTTDASAYTFAGQSLGAAADDRYIVVSAVGRKAGAAFTLLSISIGGVAATIITQITNTITNSDAAALVIAKVPTGATGDIVVTWSTTILRCQINVWRLTGISSPTPSDFDQSTAADPSVNLDIPANGGAIGAGLTAAASSATWTGLTEDSDSTLESFVTQTAAHSFPLSLETGRTITIDFASSTESAGVFASWAPTAAQAAIVLSLSPNFVDGAATTAQMTSPSGKSGANFDAGKIVEATNPPSAVDIGNNNYTEMEYCLQASVNAEDDVTYEFRVTSAGVVLDSYSQTPEWTIGAGGLTLPLLGAG